MIIKIYFAVFVIFVLLCGALLTQYRSSKKYKALYDVEANNYKATIDKNRVLMLTNVQLKYQQDSILSKMDSIVKSNKIKKPQTILYTKEVSKRSDTIIIKDTIFVTGFKLDTIIGDKWFNDRLVLEYPSKIIIEPEYNNEKYIITNLKKETVKPKKIWPLCILQRKQWIEEIKIIDINPYVKNKEVKYVKIIK